MQVGSYRRTSERGIEEKGAKQLAKGCARTGYTRGVDRPTDTHTRASFLRTRNLFRDQTDEV